MFISMSLRSGQDPVVVCLHCADRMEVSMVWEKRVEERHLTLGDSMEWDAGISLPRSKG